MNDQRARLTIGRDYCRGCETQSVQRFAGWATEDGHENSCRPRAFYRQCERCGTPRLVLGNLNDAEGLCRKVLKAWLDRSGTGAFVGPTGPPRSDGKLDAEEALAHLQQEVWRIYLAWTPELSPSFLGRASKLLPMRLDEWSRDASGEAQHRPGGRRFPKAHAASVSVSLDGIADGGFAQDGDGAQQLHGDAAVAARAISGADPGFGGFVADHAEAGSPDLLRVLTAGSGGDALVEQGAGNATAERAAPPD